MSEKQHAWDLLVEEIKNSPCAQVYPHITNVVIGRGGLSPKVLFIGEAPGAEEDRLGKPFVGRSGKLLDQWIAFLGLAEDEYYIANVMKTRPPENRDPKPDEIALCKPYLAKQVEILNPTYIVAVGRFAMNYFFPKKKGILKESGKLIDGTHFIVPHPSYFLRNGGSGWEPYLDSLREILGGKAPPEKQQRLF